MRVTENQMTIERQIMQTAHTVSLIQKRTESPRYTNATKHAPTKLRCTECTHDQAKTRLISFSLAHSGANYTKQSTEPLMQPDYTTISTKSTHKTN